MSKTQRTNEWLTSNLKDQEFRRLFKQELLVEEFITRVEETMVAFAITKTELAKRMQCSVAKVSRALRSPATMTLATLLDIAFSLNIQLEVVLYETKVPECLTCGVRVSARRRAGCHTI